MRVAIVHDWLTVYAGAEKVLEQILYIWPDADIFSVVDFLSPDQRGFLKGKVASTTFVQRLPFARNRYRNYLPLMPLAVEQLDLSGYDLIISSSYAVAKGVLSGPDQCHVSYVHSPIRYAWDLQHQYLKEAGISKGMKSWLARLILHYVRIWDSRTANGVDLFIANSHFVSRRIKKVYGRASSVLYPPVDIDRFLVRHQKESFFLTASRMVPYKMIPLIIEAFSQMPDKTLVVIGDGPEYSKAKAVAGPNVRLLGYQTTDILIDHMQRARAFIFAAEEDFGITPVEAQACGTPVIAYGRGGALETVIGAGDENVRTGVFFASQQIDDICAAVREFESLPNPIATSACRRNAERFSIEAFRNGLERLVEQELIAHRGRCALTVSK